MKTDHSCHCLELVDFYIIPQRIHICVIESKELTEREVLEELQRLDTSKASGPDKYLADYRRRAGALELAGYKQSPCKHLLTT